MDHQRAIRIGTGALRVSPPELRRTWQWLHDTGVAYNLGGDIGFKLARRAESMLARGVIAQGNEEWKG
jgi:hypothetical protein